MENEKSKHGVGGDRAMTISQAAEYLGYHIKTFYNLRSKGLGPDFYDYDGKIVYRLKDLDRWKEQFKVSPEKESA